MATGFGELIAQGRAAHRWTLRQLGRLLEVSPSYLSELEHGRRPAPDDKDFIKRLAKFLDLDFATLWDQAKVERAARATGFLEKRLGTNRDLAFQLYRAGENADEEKWKKAIEEAIRVFEEGDD